MPVQALEVHRQTSPSPDSSSSVPRWFSIPLLLSIATLALFIQTLFPWALLAAGSCVLLGLVVYRYPIAGIWMWLVLYPINSCNFSLHGSGLQSIVKMTVYVFPVEILNVILMLVLVVQQLAQRQATWNRCATRKSGICRWLLFLAALFVASTVCVVLLSDNITGSVIGGWRLVGNFFAVAFMMVHLKRFSQFVRALLFYCSVASVYALLAIAATNYGFRSEYQLVQTADYGLFAQLALYNRGGQYFSPVSGMIAGVGLSGKHELSMLTLAGTTFLAFLLTRYRSNTMRFIAALMLALFASVYHQAFSRTSMAGSFLILAMTIALVAPWRKWLAAAMLVFLILNLVGFAGAFLLQPEHQRKMSSIGSKLIKTSSRSKFESSSIGERMHIWGQVFERIGRSRGLGTGPDSLNRDFVFRWPHGHNIFLTFAAEYGIPAMLLFTAALLLIFTASYQAVFASPRVRDPVWLLQLTLVVTTLLALFEYQVDVHVFYAHFWVMIGLLLAALKNLPEESAARLSREPGPLLIGRAAGAANNC